LKYRSDIDGLRALAIIPVVLFHAGVKIFSGGYIGVDIFFVISGYVIALGLLEDLKNGDFSFLKFYAKRIRRIFPALFTTIAVTSVFAWHFMLLSHLVAYSESVAAAATFTSNILFWNTTSYFAPDALTRPLLHTWTLSVEGQYYILIPMCMWFIWRHLKGRLALVLGVAIIASLALSIYVTVADPIANYLLLPTRAWELLIGAFLATCPLPPIKSLLLREAAGIVALLLITVPVFVFTPATAFPGVNALYPCLGSTLLIYLGGGPGSRANKLLQIKPLVWTGLISYSLYLVHWPIVAFTTYLTATAPTPVVSAQIIGASFALAYLSWRWVEQPFRTLSIKNFGPYILSGGVATILVFSVGAGVVWHERGFPSRFTDFAEQVIPGHELWREGTCFLHRGPDKSLWKIENCTLTHGDSHRALLWGDSFAAQYVPGIEANAAHLDATFIEYAAASCPPILFSYPDANPRCLAFSQNALQIIKDNHIDSVILSARWRRFKGNGLEQLGDTIAELKKRGVSVTVLGQSPEFADDVQVLTYRKLGFQPDGSKRWELRFDPAFNDEVAAYAQGATFINPLTFLCDKEGCPYFKNNQYLFEDDQHLSQVGSTLAVAAFFPLQKN